MQSKGKDLAPDVDHQQCRYRIQNVPPDIVSHTVVEDTMLCDIHCALQRVEERRQLRAAIYS